MKLIQIRRFEQNISEDYRINQTCIYSPDSNRNVKEVIALKGSWPFLEIKIYEAGSRGTAAGWMSLRWPDLLPPWPGRGRVVVVIISYKDRDLVLCSWNKVKIVNVRRDSLKRSRLSRNNLADGRGIPSRVIKGPLRSMLNHRIPVVLIKDPLLDKRIAALDVINIRERTDTGARERNSAFRVLG